MKQGTISILFGCHSFVHCFLVWLSWRKLYGKFPTFKETVCILLHDIGHWGLDYLNDVEQKKAHWRTGATIAGRWFGFEYFLLTAGHCEYSRLPSSKMAKAYKYSWYIAPRLWVYTNCLFEPKLMNGLSFWKATDLFKARVKDSIESGEFRSTHQFYLERHQN